MSGAGVVAACSQESWLSRVGSTTPAEPSDECPAKTVHRTSSRETQAVDINDFLIPVPPGKLRSGGFGLLRVDPRKVPRSHCPGAFPLSPASLTIGTCWNGSARGARNCSMGTTRFG